MKTVIVAVVLLIPCSACTVLSVAGTAVSTTVSVAATVVETGVSVAGSAIRGVANTVSGSDEKR
jgi:hypothetical protein